MPREHRIKNRGYGVCAWCALETSGRHLGIKSLYDLAAKRDAESRKLVQIQQIAIIDGVPQLVLIETPIRNNGGTIRRMRKQLDALEVKYVSQLEGNFDTKILYEATTEGGPGAAVGIHGYYYTPTEQVVDECFRYQGLTGDTKGGGYHDILLTHIDKNWVKFIDSNDIRRHWIASRKWFDSHWDGAAIVIVGGPEAPKTMDWAD